jgi:hypothetical protein
MAVATKPDAMPDTDAQARLRQAVQDVERQLRHPNKSDLAQAKYDLDRRWTVCSEELRRLSTPHTRRAPRAAGIAEPETPDEARAAQLRAIAHAVELLEHANHVRARANLALFQAR